MQITKQAFGLSEDGTPLDLYTLTNDSGSLVRISNYGGIITELIVPNRNDEKVNVVLGFDTADEYYSNDYNRLKPYFGAIIGRYANRIGTGGFTIDGKRYQIPHNLGNISLHGGTQGFDRKVWTAETMKHKDSCSLHLSYLSKHMEEGFPGNLKVRVKYTWTQTNELIINYTAETDRKTHLNLTNHAYFNLNGGREDVLAHAVMINANSYTEVDDDAIPTGNLTQVKDTCMDFTGWRLIGERIGEASGIGYDHNYVINDYDGELRSVAAAKDTSTGICMEVQSTEPGLQFFTANHLDGTIKRGDWHFDKRSGICFETQHFPDTPNRPEFPSTLLKPGEKFESTTKYSFSNIP